MRLGELLSPIAAAIGGGLVSGTYIQADETPVGVQMHDSRGKNHQAYLWQYGRPGGHVVFDFRSGVDATAPGDFWDSSKASCKLMATPLMNRWADPR